MKNINKFVEIKWIINQHTTSFSKIKMTIFIGTLSNIVGHFGKALHFTLIGRKKKRDLACSITVLIFNKPLQRTNILSLPCPPMRNPRMLRSA